MTESIEDFQKQLADEYCYRALGPIDVDGVRAYNKGHLVPASNVLEHGYLDDGLVEKIGDDVEPPAPAVEPNPPSQITKTPAPAAEPNPPSQITKTPAPAGGANPPAAVASGPEKKD